MNKLSKKQAFLSLSGGLDSSSLLLHLLKNDYAVTAISFLYGQKHAIEVDYAKRFIDYLNQAGYPVQHRIINLEGLNELLFSSLVNDDIAIPEGHYAKDNMRSTVVPNRNKIFSSLLQSAALSCAQQYNTKVVIALGIHAGDSVTYPDCRPNFVEADYNAFLIGNWDAESVTNYLPYLHFNKVKILQDGLASCEQLNLDFNEIYKRTITSYNPNAYGISDYKSASSVQRIEAFMQLGKVDPTPYADDDGIVSWETVTAHVNHIIKSSTI